MYRLILTPLEYEEFKKEVKIELIRRDMTVRELAERTNYSESSIRSFMSNRNSKFIAFAIAEVLGEKK